jgi:hypothetical protein
MSTNDISTSNILINDISLTNEFNLTKFMTNCVKDLTFSEIYKLDNDSVMVIYLILSKYPKLLDDMSVHLKNIINDSVINNKDLPEMLLLMSEVLNTNTSELNKLKLTRKQVINFVKDVLIILIESKKIKINSTEKDIVLSLLDVSIKLLESKVNVKKVASCFSFFF